MLSATSKTASSTPKANTSESITGSLEISLTADEISYFRNVAQDYRQSGLKELKQNIFSTKPERRSSLTRRQSLTSSVSTGTEVHKIAEDNNESSNDILYTIMSHDSTGPLRRNSTTGSEEGSSRLNSVKQKKKPSLTDEEMSYFLMLEEEKRKEEGGHVNQNKLAGGPEIAQGRTFGKDEPPFVPDDSMSPEELAFFALMEQERIASK
jgi:hypothetical protein